MNIEELEAMLYVMGVKRRASDSEDTMLLYHECYVGDLIVIDSQLRRSTDPASVFSALVARIHAHKEIHGE